MDQPIKNHSSPINPPKDRKTNNLPEIPIDKKQIIGPNSGAPARPKKGLKPIDTPKRRPPPPPPPQTPKTQPEVAPTPPAGIKNPPSSSGASTPKLVLAGGTLVMIQEPHFEEEVKEVSPKTKTSIIPKEPPKVVPAPVPPKVAPVPPVRESVLSIDDLDKVGNILDNYLLHPSFYFYFIEIYLIVFDYRIYLKQDLISSIIGN